MTEFYLVLAILMFIGLVVIHEWGHFIMARRNGVEVEEFGIGFPPKVWAKKIKTKKSEFLFTINALPLGGFVRMKGENDADDRPGSFGAASLGAKVKILVAGVFMNLVTAIFLFMLLAWVGMPKLVDNQFTVNSDTKIIAEVQNKGSVLVDSVNDNSPAQRAGLQAGDRILSLEGRDITATSLVGEVTRENAGEEIDVIVQRGEETLALNAQLNAENDGSGFLGVTMRSGEEGREVRRSTWSAPVVALGLTAQFTQLTLEGIGKALGNLAIGQPARAAEQVTGPVGIAYILDAVSKEGFIFVLMVIALISLTLAIMNILPIPALDGGRLFVLLAFSLAHKKLTARKENLIHGVGFALLIMLFILITIVDVDRFILN